MTAFDDLVSGARESLIEHAEYAADFLNGMSESRVRDWLDDEYHEIVDGAVPVYNNEIMDVAKDPRVWSQDTADYGEARDLIQAAQWAIYAAIDEALREDDSILAEIMAIADRVNA